MERAGRMPWLARRGTFFPILGVNVGTNGFPQVVVECSGPQPQGDQAMTSTCINLLSNVYHPPDLHRFFLSDRSSGEASSAPQIRRLGRNLADLSDLKGCVLLTITDVMQLTGLGRTSIYEMLAGPLASVKVGRRRLIPAEALEEWRAGLRPSRPSAKD